MKQDRTFTVSTSHSAPVGAPDINEALQVPEVRYAVARFRSAALTVASYEAMDSAGMTPDEHNTWYDKLNVMREARAVLAEAGQLHLIDESAVRPRRLIAAGIKRGNGQLVVKAVA